MAIAGEKHLIDLLESHGQRFLKAFETPQQTSTLGNKRRRQEVNRDADPQLLGVVVDETEEWGGIFDDSDTDNRNASEGNPP